jgi:CubicO group peptidase (beta-lactamase class C family)
MEQAIEALPVEPATDKEWKGIRQRTRWALTGGMAALVAVAAVILALTIFRAHSTSGQTQSALGRKLDAYLTSLTGQSRMSGTVLVARQGQIILSKGYGLADRQHRVANGPTVKYPAAGVSYSINLVAALKLEEEGTLHAGSLICTYLSHCPATWSRRTVGQVVSGTSGLEAVKWWQLPGTPAESLSNCENEGALNLPAGTTNYKNCVTLVLGTIFQKITGQPWETVIRHTVLDPAGMHDTARLADALKPPARANDYNGNVPGTSFYYSPYLQLYSTTPDILRYDDALFGNRLLSPQDLQTLTTPRDSTPDAGVTNARMAYEWKVGQVAGQRVIYTYTTVAPNLTLINMRFPRESTSIIVVSNDRADDAAPIGADLARLSYAHVAVLTTRTGPIPSVSPVQAIQATIDVRDLAALETFANHTVLVPYFQLGTLGRVSSQTNQIAGVTNVANQLSPTTPEDPLSVASGSSQVWIILNTASQVARID